MNVSKQDRKSRWCTGSTTSRRPAAPRDTRQATAATQSATSPTPPNGTINGTGEQVKTAELVAHGYTVTYQASSHCLIAAPVNADGSDGIAVISECGQGEGSASGTTTYRGTGRTTFHVYNTEGPWTLTFNPL